MDSNLRPHAPKPSARDIVSLIKTTIYNQIRSLGSYGSVTNYQLY